MKSRDVQDENEGHGRFGAIKSILLFVALAAVTGAAYFVNLSSLRLFFAGVLAAIAGALTYVLLGMLLVSRFRVSPGALVPFSGFAGGCVFGVAYSSNILVFGLVGAVILPTVCWLERVAARHL